MWNLIISISVILFCAIYSTEETTTSASDAIKINSIATEEEAKSEGPSTMEPNSDNKTAVFSAVVKLYIQDVNKTVKGQCTGVFITPIWLISSATCLNDATHESMLRVCSYSENKTEDETCEHYTYAYKIVFLRHSWFNNMAFVQTDGSLGNDSLPVSWAVDDAPPLDHCRVIGFTRRNNTRLDVLLSTRRACRRAHYCLDDATGWSCRIDYGSALMCNGIVRGVYASHHQFSCDPPMPIVSDDVEPVEEERWALLFFISFDAYEDVIKQVLSDEYFATDDISVNDGMVQKQNKII